MSRARRVAVGAAWAAAAAGAGTLVGLIVVGAFATESWLPMARRVAGIAIAAVVAAAVVLVVAALWEGR